MMGQGGGPSSNSKRDISRVGQFVSWNLLTGLDSLDRLSKRDQQRLAMRLRDLSAQAKADGSISVAANLIRAVYQLEKA